MANDRLREALLKSGLTMAALAEAVDVSEKTVERWITKGRTPYRNHRRAVATCLGVDEAYLWPASDEEAAALARSEIVTVHPRRQAVPEGAWTRLFAKAEREIGILTDAFPLEDAAVRALLAEKARAGVRVRVLLCDPADEGGAGGQAELAGLLQAAGGVEVRRHDLVMYGAIHRADDELFVDLRVHGGTGVVLHLCKIAGGEFASTYLESFEHAWARARAMPDAQGLSPTAR